jgi:hypothetical protein
MELNVFETGLPQHKADEQLPEKTDDAPSLRIIRKKHRDHELTLKIKFWTKTQFAMPLIQLMKNKWR